MPDDSDETFRRLTECLQTLEAIVEDRTLLDHIAPDARRDLLVAAGRISRPDRNELRAAARVRRRSAKREAREAREAKLARTGIRQLRAAPLFVTPEPLLLAATATAPEPVAELDEARACYVCKTRFTEVHHFYDQLCPECGDLSFERRNRTADLTGRVALVTGARVKIGYQAAIKLLRAGASVIVTTRFPNDAARRYAAEEDFAEWGDRLSIYGLDLRHTPSVERLCEHLRGGLSRLDFIINNACQTVRRPAGFYQHLLDNEAAPDLPERAHALLEPHRELRSSTLARRAAAVADSVKLSQVALLPEDLGRDLHLFPDGRIDADGQQLDLRTMNSWRLTLDQVPTVELLEVQLVNAVAPYVLNGRLRGLMNRTPERDKHIVNVSAMEGQFYRAFKTDKHPHTNMAKAALNMMTRTSAIDYVNDGIHMNSVDTGWVTDEDPAAIAARKVEVHGFHPPLDIVDGAARIVDPIFHGFLTGEHIFGQFLKDYRAIPW